MDRVQYHVLALLLLTGAALAQDAPTSPAKLQPTALEQAVGEKLLAELNANIACNAQLIELKRAAAEKK